jgi:hypothetical protein
MDPHLERYLTELHEELLRQGVPPRAARVVVEECGFHLESECEELVATGLSPRRAVRRTLCGFGPARELARAWATADAAAPPRWCWIVVCSLGLGLGLLASLPVGRWVGAVLGMLLILPAIGLVAGVVLGLSQGWALRRRLGWLVRWVAGSALGLGAGLTAGTTLVESLGLERGRPADEIVGLLLIGAIMGSALAMAQWQLARRSLAGAGRWVLAHGLGAGAGLVAGSLLAHGLDAATGVPGLAFTVLGGTTAAAWAGSRELDSLLAPRAAT